MVCVKCVILNGSYACVHGAPRYVGPTVTSEHVGGQLWVDYILLSRSGAGSDNKITQQCSQCSVASTAFLYLWCMARSTSEQGHTVCTSMPSLAVV